VEVVVKCITLMSDVKISVRRCGEAGGRSMRRGRELESLWSWCVKLKKVEEEILI